MNNVHRGLFVFKHFKNILYWFVALTYGTSPKFPFVSYTERSDFRGRGDWDWPVPGVVIGSHCGYTQTIRNSVHAGDLDSNRTPTSGHADERKRVRGRSGRHVFVSCERVTRWVRRVPGLLALTGGRTMEIFSWRKLPDCGQFHEGLKRVLLVTGEIRENVTEKPDVPLALDSGPLVTHELTRRRCKKNRRLSGTD